MRKVGYTASPIDAARFRPWDGFKLPGCLLEDCHQTHAVFHRLGPSNVEVLATCKRANGITPLRFAKLPLCAPQDPQEINP